MSSIPYEPMGDEEEEEASGPRDQSPIATIQPNEYQQVSTLPSPPNSVLFTRANGPRATIYTSALPPGEVHQAQPHDLDYGAVSEMGTLNLLAMSQIRLKARHPMEITCPHCYMQIVTMLVPQRGVASYLLFILLILCGCILGCCLIPLYWTQCLDIKHICPHCGKLIGVCKLL